MDVDLTIRYSDDRACEVVVCRTNEQTPLLPNCQPPCAPSLDESLTEAMREVRRFYEGAPCRRGATAKPRSARSIDRAVFDS